MMYGFLEEVSGQGTFFCGGGRWRKKEELAQKIKRGGYVRAAAQDKRAAPSSSEANQDDDDHGIPRVHSLSLHHPPHLLLLATR